MFYILKLAINRAGLVYRIVLQKYPMHDATIDRVRVVVRLGLGLGFVM